MVDHRDPTTRAAWSRVVAEWPPRRWRKTDYERIYGHLCDYFCVVFAQFEPPELRAHVVVAVDAFMASWLAGPPRRGRGTSPAPDDVRAVVMDALLEHARAGVPPGIVRGPSVQDDESLAARALRAKPDVVRAGLRALFEEGDHAGFQVVTQYLAMADIAAGRPPPTSAVVRRLNDVVDELQARHVIRAFQLRLRRIGSADATE